MKAGRELDALVAEKVMGTPKYWSVLFAGSNYGNIYNLDDAQHLAEKIQGDYKASIVTYYDEPAYSTDIAAAWEVVEKFGHAHVILEREVDWYCLIAPDETAFASRYADTAPLAICFAALKAVGCDAQAKAVDTQKTLTPTDK